MNRFFMTRPDVFNADRRVPPGGITLTSNVFAQANTACQVLPPLKPRRKEDNCLRKRNCRVEIYMTEKERQDLMEKVNKSGLTRERYMRKIIAGSRVFEAPPVDFATLIREVNRVGSNIDQILRLAYTRNLLDVPRLRQELDELDAIEDAMWQAFAPDGR